jgi:hypothetical protein
MLLSRRVRLSVLLIFASTLIVTSAYAKPNEALPTVPDSRSDILSASVLFSFKLSSAAKTKRGPIPNLLGGYAEYAIAGVVLKTYKGALAEADGQAFHAAPYVYAGPIRSRPRGLWVGVSEDEAPHAGEVALLACRKPATAPSASALLGGLGEGCQLMPPSAGADIELAVQMETSHASLQQAVAALSQTKSHEPSYYVEYVFARYADALRAPHDWQPLFDLLSDPSVPRNFREQLFENIDEVLASMDTLPVPLRDAYLLALCRAVLLYREPTDQANLLSTRVKNWARAQPVAAADLVFQHAAELRTRVLALVRQLPASDDLRVVERWLVSKR